MSWFSKSNKDKKEEKSATSKSRTITKSEGDEEHSTVVSSYVRQISSISHSTEVRTTIKKYESNSSFTSQNSFNSSGSSKSLQNIGSGKDIFSDLGSPKLGITFDASPSFVNRYKAAPARSVYTSQPSTSVARLPLDVGSRLQPIPKKNSLPNLTSQVYAARQPVTPTAPAQPTDILELRQKLVVKVTKSTQFRDNSSQLKVPVYKTRSKHRGKLLLINNIKFIDEKKIRKGAEYDEENAWQLFKQMGFEVVKHRDLKKKDMETKIKNFRSDASLKKYDITAVMIMSHGTGKEHSGSTEVACIDGELLHTTWIINQFDSTESPHLSGKPKIFIFQCCRGDNINQVQYDAAPFIPRQVSDILVAYSTVPGFVSHRDPETGSWYIQTLCRVFMEHAHDLDVESLLKIVDHRLASLVANGSTQTSSFENRGFKTCYFHPQLSER